MEAINPLALSELLARVGQYMDKRTLNSCIRVSHTWHDILLPCLWYDAKISFIGNCSPPADDIEKNATHIRKLCVNGFRASDMKMFNCSFLLLSVLALRFRYPVGLTIITFLRRHASSLTDISIDGVNPDILVALNECPNLKRLKLYVYRM